MIFQGKTVDEAVEAGLKELGIARENAEIKVLEHGKKGILGIGAVPAKVEISVLEKTPAAEPEVASQTKTEAPMSETKAQETASGSTDGQRAVLFLEGLFPLIGSQAKPVLQDEGEKIVINLEGAEKSVIGRRGEVIDAIQTIAGAIANTGRKEYKRVVVDCENYREQREETLKRVAEKMAEKAVRLGKRVRLEPMNPYERRIIHSALVDHPDVTTKSEGKEPARYVVITPKNPRTDKRGGRNDRNDRRGGRGRDTRDGEFKGKGRGDRDRGGRNGKYGERKPYPKRDLPADATPETSGTSFSRGSTPGYKKGGFSGFFGTYLGKAEDEAQTPVTQSEASMSETEPVETSGTAFKPEE